MQTRRLDGLESSQANQVSIRQDVRPPEAGKADNLAGEALRIKHACAVRQGLARLRVGLVAVGLIAVTVTAADAQGLWPLGGRNVRNTRHQRGEREIDVASAASLQRGNLSA